MNDGTHDLFGVEPTPTDEKPSGKKPRKKTNDYDPPNLGKAIRLPVSDFSDPDRPPVCLEVDFPIVPINALSNLEGNAGKPIYQMSKWWARRRSSVFRSLLIAAATEAPEDPSRAAKQVWEHYYSNHQKAGHFRKLRVLDIFMGGGTTLVEGARLGFQMAGVDLNPVAWFVTKNELACSDPEQVKALFEAIEAEVKPLIQPFYTTTCPRGHTGRWVNRETNEIVNVDPAEIPPDQRSRYRWEGPEIIYTFWAKHGPCDARDCNHRTPIFRSPFIAEKKLTAYFIPSTCPYCGHEFNIELGETRMAPGVERVVLDNEPGFTETSQEFAQLLKDYSKGNKEEKQERICRALEMLDAEAGVRCPKCGSFAGERIKRVLENHRGERIEWVDQEGNTHGGYDFKAGNVRKASLGIESRHVFMYLLIHPEWLEGSSGLDDGRELGGYAGADPELTARWFEKRLEGMNFVEVRGRIRLADEEIAAEDEEESGEDEDGAGEDDAGSAADRKKFGLPREIVLADGTRIQTRTGTVPQKSHFVCQKCGKTQDILESVKPTKHTAPVAAYALQCYCPQCEAEGYSYNGRYFKPIEPGDVKRLIQADREWAERNEADLKEYWPRSILPYAWKTSHWDIQGHGYTHWWKMFNPRQLLVHTQLMRAITEAPENEWPLDVREQALGALQQYLRNQNMFCFWDKDYDKLVPMMSNANFHPKALVVENCIFHKRGRGNFESNMAITMDGLSWVIHPWDSVVLPETEKARSIRVSLNDPIQPGSTALFCGSSTDLSMLNGALFDLVITDPPFGDNINYADLADFFYAWIRLPLLKWYRGMSEHKYFKPEFTPKVIEAIINKAEHPDDREDFEREPRLTNGILAAVRERTGNRELGEKDPNPLYRPEPASDFYQQTLTACWAEAGRLLKQGGLLAFTFHHKEYDAWVNVLASLFDAKFVLIATYPIQSDETKGARAQFGSQSIQYDIVHVCRKRLEEPKAVSWAKMRLWVKDEAARLKVLLEHSHGKDLPESDIVVILFGKALEFYSRHYGRVFTGDGQVLGVRDALLGINLLLDDLLTGNDEKGNRRPPDAAEPASRLFLRVFQSCRSMARDELHKTLRGTGVSQGDFEARGWIRVVGTQVFVIPVAERFQYFTAPGRNRKVLKTDLDQAHFLIGAASPGSGVNVSDELNRATFRIKGSVVPILDWCAQTDPDREIQRAAALAMELVGHWRAKQEKAPASGQMTLFEQLEAEVE